MRTLVFAINGVLETIVVAHRMLNDFAARGDNEFVMAFILRLLIPACLILFIALLVGAIGGWLCIAGW